MAAVCVYATLCRYSFLSISDYSIVDIRDCFALEVVNLQSDIFDLENIYVLNYWHQSSDVELCIVINHCARNWQVLQKHVLSNDLHIASYSND